MVVKAICGKEGLLDVQTHRRLDKSCQDIPVGFAEVLPKNYVQWAKERDERRIIKDIAVQVNLGRIY